MLAAVLGIGAFHPGIDILDDRDLRTEGVKMRVGIRELRDQLKHYVERARNGEDVIITEHGQPVARLVALHDERPVDRLIKAGLATPPKRTKEHADWEIVNSSGSVSDLIER